MAKAKLSLGGKPIKAKLTLGGARIGKHWGAPSPLYNYKTGRWDDRGMIWSGPERPTRKEIMALKAIFGPKVRIDGNSKRGTNHPKYNTFASRNRGKGPYKQSFKL